MRGSLIVDAREESEKTGSIQLIEEGNVTNDQIIGNCIFLHKIFNLQLINVKLPEAFVMVLRAGFIPIPLFKHCPCKSVEFKLSPSREYEFAHIIINRNTEEDGQIFFFGFPKSRVVLKCCSLCSSDFLPFLLQLDSQFTTFTSRTKESFGSLGQKVHF